MSCQPFDSPSTPRAEAERSSLPAGRQGLTLQFDRLSVLSLSKEAALLCSAFKGRAGPAERVSGIGASAERDPPRQSGIGG